MRSFLSSARLTLLVFTSLISARGWAQSSQYQRAGTSSSGDSSASPPTQTPSTGTTKGTKADAKAQATSASDKTTDKIDISDIEKKYWAPKDTDFTVVQNRLYSKAHRLSLTLGYGLTVNDSYNNGDNYEAILNYYWSERYGMQLTYIDTVSVDNKLTTAFREQNGALPDYNKATGFYGAAFNWVPFYAKMSFLNSKIMYFDLSISPGIGDTSYHQLTASGNQAANSLTYTLDITQQLFLSKNFAFRFDFQNHWYNETVLKYQTRGDVGGGTPVSEDFNHTIILLFGITAFY
jgi:outer membrane beta-barrel protein